MAGDSLDTDFGRMAGDAIRRVGLLAERPLPPPLDAEAGRAIVWMLRSNWPARRVREETAKLVELCKERDFKHAQECLRVMKFNPEAYGTPAYRTRLEKYLARSGKRLKDLSLTKSEIEELGNARDLVRALQMFEYAERRGKWTGNDRVRFYQLLYACGLKKPTQLKAVTPERYAAFEKACKENGFAA